MRLIYDIFLGRDSGDRADLHDCERLLVRGLRQILIVDTHNCIANVDISDKNNNACDWDIVSLISIFLHIGFPICCFLEVCLHAG